MKHFANFSNSSFSLLAMGMFLFLAASCNKKTAETTEAPPKGEVRIERLCDIKSDSENLRVSATGESVDRVQAERKALNNARAQMGSQLETTVQALVDNFTQSMGLNADEEFNEVFRSIQRDVVNASISYRTICNELTRNSEGRFVSYVAIELSDNELFKHMGTRINREDKLRLEYDYERFKKDFEAEMEKMR